MRAVVRNRSLCLAGLQALCQLDKAHRPSRKPLIFPPSICRVGNDSRRDTDTLAVSTRPEDGKNGRISGVLIGSAAAERRGGCVVVWPARSPACAQRPTPLSSASWSPGNGLAGGGRRGHVIVVIQLTQHSITSAVANSVFAGLQRRPRRFRIPGSKGWLRPRK
ncbi:hypothetical protein VTG60DRAFT_5442 [Thermothelomyces hinnuleus]